jgi:hypothetical protein
MRRALLCLGLLVCGVSSAFAQAAPAASSSTAPQRGWLDVNFLSLKSNQDVQAYAFADTIFLETRTFATGYPELPSAKGAGLDVGIHINPQFALGLNVNAVNYEYQGALVIDVPHPTRPNRYANDVDVTADRLERQDRGYDISLIYVPRTPDVWRVRVFGGPTYFTVKQQMVSDIIYDQVFNLAGFNSVDIQRYQFQNVDGNAWGLHAGVDVGYFFSRFVGVGGVVRFNRGTVTVEDPLSGEDADLKAGHLTLGGGLRLRF